MSAAALIRFTLGDPNPGSRRPRPPDAQVAGLPAHGGGVIQQMIGAVLERALETEMADHLGYHRARADSGWVTTATGTPPRR